MRAARHGSNRLEPVSEHIVRHAARAMRTMTSEQRRGSNRTKPMSRTDARGGEPAAKVSDVSQIVEVICPRASRAARGPERGGATTTRLTRTSTVVAMGSVVIGEERRRGELGRERQRGTRYCNLRSSSRLVPKPNQSQTKADSRPFPPPLSTPQSSLAVTRQPNPARRIT